MSIFFKIPCLICNSSIVLTRKRDIEANKIRKYCSRICYYKARSLNIREINYSECDKKFKVGVNQKHRRKCCSKNCQKKYYSKDYNRDKKSLQCLNLAKEGKTIKEISIITGFPAGSVATYLNKLNFRRYADGGKSYAAVKNRLNKIHKECKICSFSRIVEICHIIPASEGGDLTENNTLGLCPTHHHLFDHKKLLFCEAIKLIDKVSNFIEYVSK